MEQDHDDADAASSTGHQAVSAVSLLAAAAASRAAAAASALASAASKKVQVCVCVCVCIIYHGTQSPRPEGRDLLVLFCTGRVHENLGGTDLQESILFGGWAQDLHKCPIFVEMEEDGGVCGW